MRKKTGNFTKGKYISTLVVTALVTVLLSACGTSSVISSTVETNTPHVDTSQISTEADTQSITPDESESTASTEEVKVIKIGTGGSPKPWLYTDDNNELLGYDAEVVYAIDDILPQYEFIFEITEFQSIFTGIDSGIYQMGVNNISWKEERAEKYLFGNEYVGLNKAGILVRKGYDEIHSLEDLGGKKTYAGTAGLYSQIFIENYNDTHPDNPILLEYTEADTIKQYQDLDAGIVDFLFGGPVTFAIYLEEYPELKDILDFAPISDEEAKSIEDPYSYFIYPKTEEGEKLKTDVDEALKKLKENGTITELGFKYYGYDTVE